MKNYLQHGDRITVTAPTGGVASGAPVLVGAIFGVANFTAAEGKEVEIDLIGVFSLAKVSALAIAIGDKLYYDAATGLVNKTSSGNSLVGVAASAAANPSATVAVRLNGIAI
jgi:predicted RecA/RadA family phage recombinase